MAPVASATVSTVFGPFTRSTFSVSWMETGAGTRLTLQLVITPLLGAAGGSGPGELSSKRVVISPSVVLLAVHESPNSVAAIAPVGRTNEAARAPATVMQIGSRSILIPSTSA